MKLVTQVTHVTFIWVENISRNCIRKTEKCYDII